MKLYQRFATVAITLLFFVSSLSALAEVDLVTTTNDAGAGSLREAINSANGRPGLDTIQFTLPDDQPCIITLASTLPAITDAVFIDGYSQTGSLPGPIASRVIRININGAAIGANNIFSIVTDDVTIAGIALYGAPGYGIKAIANGIIAVDNLNIWGNYIGTDSTGLTAGIGNVRGGVEVNLGSGGPVSNNAVVGTNGDGVNDANEGNLIVSSSSTSGTDGDGIILWRTSTSTIAGNIVGLNKNGLNTGLGNFRDGVIVTVSCTNVIIGTDGDGVSDALESNLISGNTGRGILVAASSSNCAVAGNIIGLDAANAAAGNGTFGIELLNCSNNRIGTDGLGANNNLETNIISSNTLDGVKINSASFFGFEASSNSNTIAGNIIGSDASLALDRGNGINGIVLVATFSPFTVSDNIIGSNYDGNDDAAEANVILNNTGSGIRLDIPAGGTAATGNKIARNRIFNNNLLGIDLSGDGVTANDDGDGDTGANDLLNAPVISSVQTDNTDLIVTGFSRPGSVIEFFIPDAGPNPTPLPGGYTKSFGEGLTFLFRAQEEGTLGGITDELTGATGSYDGAVEGVGGAGTITENSFRFRIPLSALPGGVTAGTRVAGVAYLNATGAGSTSEFGGVSSITLTPVTFTSFKGYLKEGKAFISWTTTDEVNNSHFEIEKSTSGNNYKTIGTVNGKGSIYNLYNFTDERVTATVNYYRLKQVDIDGRPTYTKVLVLRGDLEARIVKAGPNPFVSNMNVMFRLDKEQTVQLRLIDQSGKQVKLYNTRGNSGTNTYNINDLHNLPKGLYTLELNGEALKLHVQVIKQ